MVEVLDREKQRSVRRSVTKLGSLHSELYVPLMQFLPAEVPESLLLEC